MSLVGSAVAGSAATDIGTVGRIGVDELSLNRSLLVVVGLELLKSGTGPIPMRSLSVITAGYFTNSTSVGRQVLAKNGSSGL